MNLQIGNYMTYTRLMRENYYVFPCNNRMKEAISFVKPCTMDLEDFFLKTMLL